MGVFRSRQFRQVFLFSVGVSAVVIAVSFCFNLFAGIMTSVLSALLLGGLTVYAEHRHRAVERLSDYLRKILHDEPVLDRMGNEEGELKVLQSDIYKMTVTLREQAEALEKDKHFLADSLADISHQLRTPLTSMNLALSLLHRSHDPNRQRELLREITTLLRRMDGLISALLKLSKIDAGTAEFQKEPIDVETLVRQSLEPLAIPMELRGQTLLLNGTKSTFIGDLVWTTEALGNLFKNCMEHMDEGGTLSVRWEENALFTELVIEDDGTGIAPEDLPHIFERFYRGKNADSSSFGIGLSLSRRIIASQEGTIKVANRPEGGTRFTIRFYKQII